MAFDGLNKRLDRPETTAGQLGMATIRNPTVMEQLEERIVRLKHEIEEAEELAALMKKNPDFERLLELTSRMRF